MVATPGVALAYFMLGTSAMWVYPMLALPTLYQLFDAWRIKDLLTNQCEKIYLYKNGDQLLVQTFDGTLHKMNIMNNQSHRIIDRKNELIFIMNNSGSDYLISNKDCKTIDYDLLDRVIKSIQIDTGKFQGLYNRLIYRQ